MSDDAERTIGGGTEGGSGDAPPSGRATSLEWLIAALSALLVGGLLAVLAVDAVRSTAQRPHLLVVTVPGGPGELRFAVRNEGGRAVENVTVGLQTPSGETMHAVIEFLPAHAEAYGAFALGSETTATYGQLEIESYLDP